MKSNDPKIEKAILVITTVVRFAPQDPLSCEVIADQISRFVNNESELKWFVDAMITQVNEWPGIPQLRAIFCTRFTPADGVYAPTECTVPGFRPQDLEAQYFAKEAAENQKRLAEYKAAKQIAPPEDSEPFPLPEVKSVPQLPKAKDRICRLCHLGSHPETFVDDHCPKCGQFSKPMNLRELEESLSIRPAEKPPETVQ